MTNDKLNRLVLFIYLIPVFGFFPAWWTLYRGQGTPKEKSISRLAIALALMWLSGYILLGTGMQYSELPHLSLWIANSAFTTTYFLVNFGLMIRLWLNKPLWLPGISRIGDRLP